MLEGFTEEELQNMAYDCQKKYEKKEIETLKKVLTGEITSNAQMIETLEDLNRDYLNEADDYEDFPTDLNPSTITCYKEADERGDSVVETTYAILRIFGIFAACVGFSMIYAPLILLEGITSPDWEIQI